MIFLSASVPQPDREFYGTENVYAIKEAVISFVRVCAERKNPFYFGGHPAITPLVWNVAKHRLEEHQMLNYVKHNRKLMNSGKMKDDRVEMFEKLLSKCVEYKRKNQYQ